jgi:hypothetical protein
MNGQPLLPASAAAAAAAVVGAAAAAPPPPAKAPSCCSCAWCSMPLLAPAAAPDAVREPLLMFPKPFMLPRGLVWPGLRPSNPATDTPTGVVWPVCPKADTPDAWSAWICICVCSTSIC